MTQPIFNIILSDLKGRVFHEIGIHRNFHRNRFINECAKKISLKGSYVTFHDFEVILQYLKKNVCW